MQIISESGSDKGADVVGRLFLAGKVTSASTRHANARRTIFGNGDVGRMTAEREAQIRQRVSNGTYNSPSFIDELARRIIRSGDL
jgi:hypothetical protein